MQVLYGTPLPPGLVAPTQGELRVRIDQLLLDDEAINHNPLVQLFESDGTVAAAAATTQNDNVTSTPARSPNRFVVPLDYCAVGPIFWGETRPTAQGQPSTPHLRRGPLTMAYPIKIEPDQFRAYLQRMTASPQGGVQLDVFVPSSYSGRPPVTVGKARLPLDQLLPGRPIHGWYPVLYRCSRNSSSTNTNGGGEGGAGLAASAASDIAQLKEIPVGKLKVSVSVEYYPTMRQAPPRGEGAHGSFSTFRQHSNKHRRHVEVTENGTAALMPQAKARRSAWHSSCAGAHDTSFSLSSSESVDSDICTKVEPIGLSSRHRPDVHHSRATAASALAQDLPSMTQRLLEQGLRLRAQMDEATRGCGVVEVEPSFLTHSSAEHHSRHHDTGLDAGTLVAAATGLDDSGNVAAVNEDVDSDDGESIYTSEASDEENFALQLQKDSEARDSRSTQHQPQHNQQSATPLSIQHPTQYTQMAAKPIAFVAEGTAAGSTPASVVLCFSHFSFAQTPATADLHQLRLSVRLSSDITTNEPTPGPLSSYVHPVPFQQSSICLHFNVCSYSEDRSKLVVEAYKVGAETELEDEDDGVDLWDTRRPRQVAREELLGLSVVGLYRQTREVVFRDPVFDSSNVFAQLEIRMQPTFTTTIVEQGGLRGSAVANPCTTPASDGVLPSSIAESSAPQLVPQKQQSVESPTPPPASLHVVKPSSTPGTVNTSISQTSPHVVHMTLTPSSGAQPKPQAYSHLSISERRRLHVVVHRAAELPRVALAQHTGRPSVRFPLVVSSPRVVADAGVISAHSYTEPSTFVTIEEIYQSLQQSISGHEKDGFVDSIAKSRARMQPIANWYVVEARSGFYDRSAVAEQSSNPHYGYEVFLQLPEVTVPVAADESAIPAEQNTFSVNQSVQPHGMVDVLEELQLNLWHSDHARQAAALAEAASTRNISNSNIAGRAKARQQEEHFWECAAYMGTCRVDLRPLRYLQMINGYYRVVCERTSSNATDQTDTDTEANTIGYMRVSVSLI